MRIGRLVFWISSLIICSAIIFVDYKAESAIPYEEKNPINVYCVEEFQEDVKKMLEKSSLGETNRVVFTNNKEEAEFILTDEITVTDTDYSKIGWSPLIVAFDDTTTEVLENYLEKGYMLEKKHKKYDINFEKVIEAVLANEWTGKIYCPNLNTREGELFYQFLLINVNFGKYPESKEQIESATQKVKDFLKSDVVVKCDTKDRLNKKRKVENELYIIFEKELEGMKKNNYSLEISYPTNTILYEIFCCCQGKHKEEIENVINMNTIWNERKAKDRIMYDYSIRNEYDDLAKGGGKYKEQDGFSYVDIPLDSIPIEE